MKRFFTDRVKTSLAIDCNHAMDVSLVSKYSCIYQPTFTAYSLSKKPLHPFPEVCQILHKSKNTENVSSTIKNSCQTCGKLSHIGESLSESGGKFSHFGESSNETCGRLSHFGESLNESYCSFSPIREQNYGYISLKI
jgi:hypothetical protein